MSSETPIHSLINEPCCEHLFLLLPVLCHQCGTLFSGDGASDCLEFDAKDSSKQKRCAPGEACLWYAWEKSKVGPNC